MRRMRALLLAGGLAAGLAAAPAWAYEPSMLNMTVPSQLQQGDLDLFLAHRFYGSVLDNPLQNLFGLTFGANVGFGARWMILPGLQARASYFTGSEELDIGAGYGYWLTSLPVGVQVDAQLISPQEAGVRGYGVFASLSAEAGPLAKVLYVTVESGYDSYLNHLGAGIGARVDLLPWLTALAELYPFFLLGGEQHPEEIGTTSAFSAGLMITTAGHQFSFIVGNSSALGERRLMAGAPPFNSIYLGFNIQRRFP